MTRIAGWAWLATGLYFPLSAIVARAWVNPKYDWRGNYISDLAARTCGSFPERGGVCSPWHPLMNMTLFGTGILIAVGALALQRDSHGIGSYALVAVAASGLACAAVGLFPIDAAPKSHTWAATVFLIAHVLGMVGLVVASRSTALTWWTVAWLAVSVIGVVALKTPGHFGWGMGVAERLAMDSLGLWRVGVGAALLTAASQSEQVVLR